jgi:uncharacterized protein (DUF433 family)
VNSHGRRATQQNCNRPKHSSGKTSNKGNPHTLHLILELIAHDLTSKQILKEYPELKQEDIKAALIYASKLLEREITVTL